MLIKALEAADDGQREELKVLAGSNPPDKVERVLAIFRQCGVDEWARELKDKYSAAAFQHMEDIAVVSKRKQPLMELVEFLVKRDY